jgi:hypothetical protein
MATAGTATAGTAMEMAGMAMGTEMVETATVETMGTAMETGASAPPDRGRMQDVPVLIPFTEDA